MANHITLIESPIVAKLIKDSSNFASAKFHSLYGVKDEVERLRSNLTAIQATLRDAEASFSQANSEQLQDWLVKLREAALDSGDVLETYATRACLRKIRRKRNPISSAIELHEAAESIKKITTRIADISRERENFHHSFRGLDHGEEAWLGPREAGSSPNTSDMYGRQDEKSKIITWLKSEESNIEGEVPVLPIIGMAGLGKTTLVQFIYNDETVKGHFTDLIWIDVKRVFDWRRVGREMVEFITEMKLKVETWSSVEKRIVENMKGKKFLLVLDDLWEADFIGWGKFHEFLKNGLKGSRVLVTTRTDEIVRTVRACQPLFLDYLPEEECWLLFAKKAFKGGQPPTPGIEELGRQIVKKCNGLPLAVTAMASLLYSCDNEREWSSINKNGIWETEEKNARNGKPAILPALRLSYEHLPSHLKQCFIYCHIFPKGYVFDKSELIKLWMAEGYVDSSGKSKLDQIGGDYFDVLRSRSFFQPQNIDNRERYRIHDLFHDLAASVSGQFTFQFVDDSPCCVPENSRRISFFCKDVEKPASEILKATKLRTILLPVNHSRNFGEALDKIFCTLKYLRVLDLSSSTMTELPKSVGKLKLLRYLDLSHTEIRELPDSICKLINLQTLRLLGCLWLYKLPKGFNNLTNLWHLELDEMFWSKCTYLPPGIGTLTNLQNLHFFRIGHDSTYGIEQLQRMNSLTGKLQIANLENTHTASAACLKEKEWLDKLVLEWSDNQQGPDIQETVLQELEPHSSLKVLQICRYKGSRLPAWMANASIENLTEVSLSSCVDIKILSLGPLRHIRSLRLKGMQNLEEWPEMDYPTLDWLQISKCPKLKTLPSFFLNLRVMKIKKCDVLKDLPVTPFLQFLILIDNIMLENWNEALIQIQTRNAEGETTTTCLPSYINLLELQIKNCQRLKGLPNVFAPQKLEISGCPLVRALPHENHSRRLQHLALDGCNDGTLVEAIPTTSSAYSLVISNIARLNYLPVSIHLSGLKTLYINECRDLESLSNDGALLSGFPSLSLLSVCGCPKLTIFANISLPSSLEYLIIKKCLNLKSFGLENCLVGLNALKDLQMEDCPQIRCFPEGGLPPSLQRLSIQRCPLLSQSFNDEGPYDQLLANIADLEIDST